MFFDKLIGAFSSDMAIDLGTANTIVSVRGRGIIINEPSVIAVKKTDRKSIILAVGLEAKEMVGKTPGNIEAIRPMRDGVIANFEMTERMIRYFIEKAHKRKAFIRPRIIICVPYGITQVERKAVKESAMSAGAREVFLIEEPMAAAIGSNIPIRDPQGNLVFDIGGGTTEIGVISLGGLVISKSIKVAGDKFDAAIVSFISKKFNLLIGERTGEEIKMQIGTAFPLKEPLSMFVKGRDRVGLLSTIELTSEDVREALEDPLRQLSESLKDVLELMPPDMAGDIVENGIIVTGGGALLRGIDKYLSDVSKLPVYIADDPILSVARGTAKALDEIDILQQLDD
jgi:rod shape-determining protein MreB